jgi:FkbM family methyltransferase
MVRLLDNAIRGLTNDPRLIEIARSLRLAGILKRCEYQIRGPSDGVFSHAIAGVVVVFGAPDATEFRTIESCYADELDFVHALANELRPGGVFYDIGSNVGQFLIPMAKIVGERGQAVGFEPHPVNYQRLMRNVALNGLANVKAFQVALGDRDGEVHIYGTRGTATVVPRAAILNGSLSVATVQGLRGDDLRMDAGLAIPKAVKVDVEGAEFGVLSGLKDTLSSPLCELLCLEVHPRFLPAEVSTEMVFSLVRSFGFNRAETRPRGSEIHLIADKAHVEA